MTAYYKLLNKRTDADGMVTANYVSTIHAQGAWNPHEQHMAPASGILAAELEQFAPRDDMRIGRISFDIYGLISFGEFSIETRVIRPGRTIELIEAKMIANQKTCIVAQAWRMCTSDSRSVEGIEDQAVQSPDHLELWAGMSQWPGGYIATIEARTDASHRLGKGIVWLNNQKAMVEGQATSDFVHLMGMVDTANGIAPRQSDGFEWAFPNLDLQIHLYRYPQGQWLGLETTQQYGADGIGLTSSVLHDEQGPFGRSEQILTLRKVQK